MTPTRVQLSNGPVKYDTPLLKTSASVFLSTRAAMAWENSVADIDNNVFGFVDLNQIVNTCVAEITINNITSEWYPRYPRCCCQIELCSKQRKRLSARRIDLLQRKQTRIH